MSKKCLKIQSSGLKTFFPSLFEQIDGFLISVIGFSWGEDIKWGEDYLKTVGFQCLKNPICNQVMTEERWRRLLINDPMRIELQCGLDENYLCLLLSLMVDSDLGLILSLETRDATGQLQCTLTAKTDFYNDLVGQPFREDQRGTTITVEF